MSEKVYVVVVLRDERHVVIPADTATAREAVAASAIAMNNRSSFRVGDSAAFAGADVVSVYVTAENGPAMGQCESLFDAVFGKRR